MEAFRDINYSAFHENIPTLPDCGKIGVSEQGLDSGRLPDNHLTANAPLPSTMDMIDAFHCRKLGKI
jgi:hypothetical protein